MTKLLRTPLFEEYKKRGAKTIDFGGWELPVQFSSIKEEHEAVRSCAGLFDVSHMGEIEVKGSDSLGYLQKMMTNDLSVLQDGMAQYNAMCYEDGGTVDDLLVYKKSDEDYLLVVNASNVEKDYAWLERNVFGDVHIKNISNEIAQLAIQGPLAKDILQVFTSENLDYIKNFRFKEEVELVGKKVLLSRTGYTGEDGFELYCDSADAAHLWCELLLVGEEKGLKPCGLGARDTLRFESVLPLYGQELSKNISPIEAGIGFAVKEKKECDFFGKEVLREQKEHGPLRKIVGIEMIERGIPRHGYEVFYGGILIGEVTTGTQIPTTKRNIGLALIDSPYGEVGKEIDVQIRGKQVKAVIVALPFYKRLKK